MPFMLIEPTAYLLVYSIRSLKLKCSWRRFIESSVVVQASFIRSMVQR